MARTPRTPRRRTRVEDESVPVVPPKTPIVGIGASAGGVAALQSLFEALPEHTGAAFVVIVHLDPTSHSELPEILAQRSKMLVRQVTGAAPLEADCVYVIPPGRQLRVTDDEIAAEPFPEPRGQRAPIDLFFRSLADQRGDGFAVILTGAGSDGALGVRAAKEAGAVILAQDPREAEYPSMPRSAIATELVDFVLPVRQIAERLVELLGAHQPVARALSTDAAREAGLRRILAHLRVRTGHDFSQYKRATLLRRLLRRMQVTRQGTLDDYFVYLRGNAEEAQALLADLLISVTTFFRDPAAFDALAGRVVPRLFSDQEQAEPIRAWVAGCATGEEAYSVAILLLEEAARRSVRPEIQVFASDIDAQALFVAREGRYPAAVAVDVTEDRLRRFFTREGEYFRVKRELRDVVLFANHSLLKDPPFSRIALATCRNLLIYLDRDLQQQVLATLHYSLAPGGYLFLGASESADHQDNLFRTIDRDARIFQSTDRMRDPLPALSHNLGLLGGRAAQTTPPAPSAQDAFTAHRRALEAAAPPSILVDRTLRAIHLSDGAGRYVRPAGGPMTNDVADLVRPELRFELRAALSRAFDRNQATLSGAIQVRFNGHRSRVFLQVRPEPPARSDDLPQRAVVLFIEDVSGEAMSEVESAESGGPTDAAVLRLHQELDLSQSRLRTTREEFEAANEELRAANEELQSINEEYRSTAEELETSKEELQSINEELQTVNSELKLKLDSVSRANSDLQNLIAATDFGILFLDPELRIKLFTPKLAELFRITPSDAGRPITDFAHQLDYDQLPADARSVLEHLTPIEREIPSRSGGLFLVRFRPYRTVDDKSDGVVATFVDVTERRRMEGALRTGEERRRLEARLVELSSTPIFVWDFDGGVVEWNKGSEELYGYTREEARGRVKEELLKTEVPGSSFAAVRKALLDNGVWAGEVRHTTKDGRQLTVEARLELSAADDRRYVLESTHDVTEAKSAAARQRLLLNELSHRVKNTLAIVQGLAHQTWRNSGAGEDFLEKLDGRITALANAHKLLIESDWTGAKMRALAESQLGAIVPLSSERIHFAGPDISLPADVATPLGLILHELGANAVKYGALSGPVGRVDLKWSTRGENQERKLRVEWSEHDGPPPTQTAKTGFGSRLIHEGLPESEVSFELERDGLRFSLEAPLPEATVEDPDGEARDEHA